MFPREASVNISELDSITFQIVSWYTCDFEYSGEDTDSSESIDENENKFYNNADEEKYLAKVFGVTEDGSSVGCNILNFTPYFYIKVNHRIDKIGVEKFRQYVVSHLPPQLRKTIIGAKLMKKKDFWGFHNNEQFNFIRFSFKSLKGFRAGIRVLSKPVYIIGMHNRAVRYQLYESNIDPFLRLVHLRNIEPAGWITITDFEDNSLVLPTKCQIDVSVDWRKVSKADIEKIAPMTVASFDIECVSSHGDFPVARKDYKKVAYEFFQLYENKKETVDELKEYLYIQLMGIFDKDFHGELSKVFLKEPLSADGLLKIKQKVKMMMDDLINIASGKIVYSSNNNQRQASDETKKNNGPTKDDILRNLTQSFGYYAEIEDDNKYNKQKEIYWSSKVKFPPLEGDPLIQIGVTVHNYGAKECNYKHIITLGDCEPIDGVVVESCQTETEVLLKWCNLMNRLDPDILTGYNILGFDMSYMYDRAIELNVKNEFCKIGRILDHVSKFEEKILSSSALGDNILKYVDMEGRVLVDVMKVVQRDHKLDSYKLDAVANHFMKMNKNDVSPNDIFRLQRGNAADRKIIADYCVQDCALCNHLMMKLEIIANNIGMANVCNVPFAYIFMRGQGIKIFSLVSKQCKEDDFVIPTLNKGRVGAFDEDAEEDEEGYEGAIVLEPKTGIYTEDPVTVLDYASLYPSSMISENLSHDCVVEIDGKYDNLPGIEYLDVSYDIYEKINEKKTKIGERVCRFTQNEKGVIPRILMTLLKQRKDTRKKIEYQSVITTNGDKLIGLYSEEGDEVILKKVDGKVSKCLKSEVVSKENTYDDFTKAVLDGLQLAYKVTANSLYGQLGAKTSPIYFKDIAACTTATGRNMILKAKNFLEDNYVGVNIVYGDSVTGYTPTIVRFNGEVFIEKFENIAPRFGGNLWLPCTENGKQTKEACELNGVEVWTDDGWTAVKRIIRHNLASHKKIIRVATHTGVVDVTDEHSLLRKDKSKVTPQESRVGDELLHNDLPVFPVTHNDISIEEARIMGMFCGDGSCGRYDCPSGRKASWAINNSDYTMLTYYKELCENVYPDYEWKILDTLKSSGVYKLVAVGHQYGAIVNLVENYRILMYCDKEKIVPQDILCSSIEVKRSFWDGLYDADGIKKNEVSTRIDQKNQISASTFTALGHSLGYKVSVNTRTDKPNIFRLTLTTGKQRKNPDAIKKMYEIDYKGYVYDFTTDNHRFSAGIGRIIVHNTDSLFISFPMEYTDENGISRKRKGPEAIQHAINMGMEASSKFKKYLKPPHDMEYEKVYFPFILISKKRYCAMKYEHNPHKGKFNSMGIALKRRDNAPIVKTIYGGVIDIIMEKQDLDLSIKFLKQSIQDLIDGKYPLESLIISKSLRADYKDPTRIAHKALAERMGERDPGNKPQVNDRIPYVYVDISEKEKKAKTAKKKILQGDRIEHPDYIRKMGLKPDYEFYITNQIMKPVSQIYALVLETMPGYKKGVDYFKQTEEKLKVEKNGDIKKVKDRLCDLREGEVQDIIFKPFLIKLENKRNKNREITDWFQKLTI
jgi:DNA polymerase elongation subunit (family B)